MVGGLLTTTALRQAAHDLSPEQAALQTRLDPLNVALVQAVGFGIAIVLGLILFRRGARVRDALVLRPVGVGPLALAAVGGLALQFPLAEVGNLAQELFPIPVEDQLMRQQLVTPDGLLSALSVILGLVAIAPLTEELLFRGLLLSGLRERYGPPVALGLTAVVFGLVHTEPSAIVYASIAGLVLGGVALRTASTLPAVVLHASVNAVPVMLPERLVRIPGFNTVSEEVYHLPLPLLLGTGVVAAAALMGMARLADAETS